MELSRQLQEKRRRCRKAQDQLADLKMHLPGLVDCALKDTKDNDFEGFADENRPLLASATKKNSKKLRRRSTTSRAVRLEPLSGKTDEIDEVPLDNRKTLKLQLCGATLAKLEKLVANEGKKNGYALQK